MSSSSDNTSTRPPSPGPLDRRDVPATREPAALITVDRAVADLRRGRMVAVRGEQGRAILIRAVERLDQTSLDQLEAVAEEPPKLALTARRAVVLGLAAPRSRVVTVTTDAPLTPETILDLADPVAGVGRSPVPLHVTETNPHDRHTASVDLMKIARLLPAAVVVDMADAAADDLEAWTRRRDLLLVDAGDIFRFEHAGARTLVPVAAARVPLFDAENATLHAFRPADGGLEHLALVIGDPEPDQPVLTRLHSECFTGDLLGSLRCDCGDQLKGAIQEIEAAGAGILLYLAQEGRGIGLVNKLRAYTLQDRGLDTIDANEQLGFEPDERIYLPAAQMLKLLGHGQVRLLTNNPDKVSALTRFGIDVVERVAHQFPSNQHNEAYLRTKRDRSGHLF